MKNYYLTLPLFNFLFKNYQQQKVYFFFLDQQDLLFVFTFIYSSIEESFDDSKITDMKDIDNIDKVGNFEAVSKNFDNLVDITDY